MSILAKPVAEISYPGSDGEPMTSSKIQYEQIVTTKGNLEPIFLDNPDIFVTSDLFWYPIEGRPDIHTASDAMVIFVRPKGHRPSYMQWLEDYVPPQVIFEIASPGNRPSEWVEQLNFYRRYGVQEYDIHDPDTGDWEGYIRQGEELIPVENMEGWVSPLLGIRFGKATGEDTGLFYLDGRPFHRFTKLGEMVKAERQRAEAEQQHAERLAPKLWEMGIKSDEEIL